MNLSSMQSADRAHTLFRIGRTAACKSGERVILAKYLSKSHAHHHLINTQVSAIIYHVTPEGLGQILAWRSGSGVSPCGFSRRFSRTSLNDDLYQMSMIQQTQHWTFLFFTGKVINISIVRDLIFNAGECFFILYCIVSLWSWLGLTWQYHGISVVIFELH